MPKNLLKDVQSVFWTMITAPEGVEEGLQKHPDIHLGQWFKGNEKLPVTRRLNIYANMYFWRIHDALKEDFPDVEKCVGANNWNNLIVDYLLAYPSATPLLQHVGRHLPQYIKKHLLSQQWPCLAELARFEWEKCMMFEAEDDAPLLLEDLKKLLPEHWPDMKLQTIRALKCLTFSLKVDRVTPLVLWKQNFVVYHEILDDKNFEALQKVQKGIVFSKICEYFGSAELAANALVQWIHFGLLAKYL